MRKVAVVNFVTLDGVMQAPGLPDEDRSGGFEDGGWARPYMDDDWIKLAGEGIKDSDALLFGRRTYEIMAAFWPGQPDDAAFAATMNHTPKYVVSNTLTEVSWQPTTLISGDVVAAITRLKEQPGKTITVLGSGELVQTLIEHDLVDEYVLAVFPLTLGSGKRLFRDGGPRTRLELVDSATTSTGGVVLTYRPRRD